MTFEWTRLVGSSSYEQAHALTTGADGSIYIAGFTGGDLDGQTNSGDYDAFLTKFNPNKENEVIGSNANDYLINTALDDDIDGLYGIDTVIYSGTFSNYSFTRASDTLEISDERTTGTTDGTDTLKNIENIQFSDQTVEESKVDVVKTYTGNFNDYKFYNKGNGIYQIKTDSGY